MRYLVAIDGSEASEAALSYALEVAEAMGASVTALHAVDPAAFQADGGDSVDYAPDADRQLVLESVEDAERRGRTALEEAAAFAAERGHDVETELLYGDPVGAITDFAEGGDFDAVFVGHRGHTDRTDLPVGSVAKGIIERVDLPVTVVR